VTARRVEGSARLWTVAAILCLLVLVTLVVRVFLQSDGSEKPLAHVPGTPATDSTESSSVPQAPILPVETKLTLGAVENTQNQFTPTDLDTMRQLEASFRTGNFGATLDLADQLLSAERNSPAFRGWLREQMPVILVSAGWTKLKLGDCDGATQLLQRSEAIRRSAEGAKGLAWCYQKLGQIAAADEQFDAFFGAVAADPTKEDVNMRLLHSDLLESQGRFGEAVKVLETIGAGLAATGGDPDLQKRLDAMRARARESKHQTTEVSRFFSLTYRIGEHEDLATFVLQTLDEALDEFVEDYGMREPPAVIEVVLYPVEEFRGAVAGGPEWAEGVFDGRLRIPVRLAQIRSKDFSGLRPVLRHELVHALNSQLTGGRGFPPWFEEGLAQKLACPRGGCPPFAFAATPGEFLAPGDFQTSYISLATVAAGMAYRQSLYLLANLPRVAQVEDPIRTIIRTASSVGPLTSDTMLAGVGTDFATLHRAAAENWKKRTSLPLTSN